MLLVDGRSGSGKTTFAERVAALLHGAVVHTDDLAWHGAVTLAEGVLVLEGVGAGRASLAARAKAVVWVQSDRLEARQRGIRREVELGRTPGEAEQFWDAWMGAEEPLLASDRPWERAAASL